MINRINYVLFKAVCSHTIIKCYVKMLKHRHLPMRGVLVIKNQYTETAETPTTLKSKARLLLFTPLLVQCQNS